MFLPLRDSSIAAQVTSALVSRTLQTYTMLQIRTGVLLLGVRCVPLLYMDVVPLLSVRTF